MKDSAHLILIEFMSMETHGKKGSNQFIKAKENGYFVVVSKETREKLSIAGSKRRHSNESKELLRRYAIQRGLGRAYFKEKLVL
jgi:hypothetical protein